MIPDIIGCLQCFKESAHAVWRRDWPGGILGPITHMFRTSDLSVLQQRLNVQVVTASSHQNLFVEVFILSLSQRLDRALTCRQKHQLCDVCHWVSQDHNEIRESRWLMNQIQKFCFIFDKILVGCRPPLTHLWSHFSSLLSSFYCCF